MQRYLLDESPRGTVDEQLDPVRRLVTKLDTAASKTEGDLVGPVCKADSPIVAHRTLLTVAEVVRKSLGCSPQKVCIIEISLQGGLAGAAVFALVIIIIQVFLPSPVQLLQGDPLGDIR